jgi:hypothetical protein
MSAMDDLVAFLRARLDEDEQVAREITAPEWSEGCSWLADLRDPLPSQRRAYGLPKEWQLLSEADTRHIARWDPARVLAEVESKRRMLELHSPVKQTFREHTQCDHCADLCHSYSGISCDAPVDALWPCPTARLLALPFADHPDYREEWAP